MIPNNNTLCRERHDFYNRAPSPPTAPRSPPCSTSRSCARTCAHVVARLETRKSPQPFLDVARFSALEAERKALQTRTEELQARRNALSQRDRQAEGQGRRRDRARWPRWPASATSSSARAERLASDAGRAQRAADGAAQPAATRACRSAPTRRPTSRCGAGARRARSSSRPRITSTSARRSGLDFETGAKLSGSRFTFLRGPIARLHRALAQFMLDVQTAASTATPSATRPTSSTARSLEGTGQLPKFKERHVLGLRAAATKHAPEQYLISTSEISLTNIGARAGAGRERAADQADRAHARAFARRRAAPGATRAA